MNHIEVELSLGELPLKDSKTIFEELPGSYLIEDRIGSGYGIVISYSSPDEVKDVSEAVKFFLEPFRSIGEQIRSHDAILRVAIYSVTFTTTIMLHHYCLALIEEFGLMLEITVYPTE